VELQVWILQKKGRSRLHSSTLSSLIIDLILTGNPLEAHAFPSLDDILPPAPKTGPDSALCSTLSLGVFVLHPLFIQPVCLELGFSL